MPDTFRLRIKKEYAAALIEDLIKVDALEAVEDDVVDLSAAQKNALDKELGFIKNNRDNLLKWDDIKQSFKKP
jgi:hypothetical protein